MTESNRRRVTRHNITWYLDTALVMLFVVNFVMSIVLAYFINEAAISIDVNLKFTCKNREVLLHHRDPNCDSILGR